MWASIAAIGAIDVLWLATTPLSISSGSTWTILRLCACIALGIVLGRRTRDWPQLHTLMTGGTMLLAAWPALRLYNHLTMSVPFPLADATLAGFDKAIGFDWLGYLHWLDRHPVLIEAMSLVYGGLTFYSAILFLLLACGRQAAPRCAEFLKLFLITAIVCITMGMFFPAVSAVIYYAPPAGTFEFIPARTGAYHLQALQQLRSDPNLVLDLRDLPGLVTFPSFHTAMGVVAIWCARRERALLAISAVVNLTMIASTPLFGAHYGIDILAGAAIACLAIAALHRFGREHSSPEREAGTMLELPGPALPTH